MTRLALRNLFHNQTRLVISVGGVALALLLMLALDAIFAGMQRQVTIYIDQSQADVFLALNQGQIDATVVTVLGIAARNGIMLVSHYRHLEVEEGEVPGRKLLIRGAEERLVVALEPASGRRFRRHVPDADGHRRWLRGRAVRLGKLELHTTSLLSGAFFILLGAVFLIYSGTSALPGLLNVDQEARLEQWARSAGSAVSDTGVLLVVAAFLAAAPSLKAVFYAGGAVSSWITQQVWDRGIIVSRAYGANAIPVAEYALASTLFSLKHGWSLARRTRAERRWSIASRVTSVATYASGESIASPRPRTPCNRRNASCTTSSASLTLPSIR